MRSTDYIVLHLDERIGKKSLDLRMYYLKKIAQQIHLQTQHVQTNNAFEGRFSFSSAFEDGLLPEQCLSTVCSIFSGKETAGQSPLPSSSSPVHHRSLRHHRRR